MSILTTRELRKIYGSGDTEVRALDGVNLSVESGEFVAIVGTSGSGKSTLLHMLGGLDRPTSGSVTVDGKEIFALKDEKLTIFRRRKMCYVFDTPDPQAEATAERFLSALAAQEGSPLMYESKATHRAHFREYQMTFLMLGGLLCAIIGIVGVLNFFNAMMTSILSRRWEFAVLQAVGQTQRQLRAMLVAEGLLYTLCSGLVSGLLSAAVNPLAGRLLENAYWFYRYHYTITPVLLLVPVFALLGYAIPVVMYRQAARQSAVERLREADA